MLNRKGGYTIWLWIVFTAVLLVSCGAAEVGEQTVEQSPAGSDDMLVPGDKIGEMVITEAEAWDWSTNLYSRCEGPGDRTEETLEDGTVVIEVTCQLAPGLDIVLSCGASAGSAQGCFGRLSTRLLRQAQHLCRMRCAAGG